MDSEPSMKILPTYYWKTATGNPLLRQVDIIYYQTWFTYDVLSKEWEDSAMCEEIATYLHRRTKD